MKATITEKEQCVACKRHRILKGKKGTAPEENTEETKVVGYYEYEPRTENTCKLTCVFKAIKEE